MLKVGMTVTIKRGKESMPEDLIGAVGKIVGISTNTEGLFPISVAFDNGSSKNFNFDEVIRGINHRKDYTVREPTNEPED